MKQIHKPSVSIVIPAYNEEQYLQDCLEAIAGQSVKPLEVIVVDNNSTDETAEIARQYSFVRLIHEKKQGVVFARDKGFNAVRGDIIGRIDVDTLLPREWVKNVQTIFDGSNLAAASGVMHYDVALAATVDKIDLFFRRRLARLLGETDTIFLQGANAAIRRSAWMRVRSHLCRRGNMHEDFDLAIHLQELGYDVAFDERMHANISARRTDVGFLQFANYVRMSPHTYAQHQLSSRKHMYTVVAAALILYVPARVLYRGYDPVNNKFSWLRVFTSRLAPARADPTKIQA
jgi:glycosyltransferase involved in cell wall biosynthesis